MALVTAGRTTAKILKLARKIGIYDTEKITMRAGPGGVIKKIVPGPDGLIGRRELTAMTGEAHPKDAAVLRSAHRATVVMGASRTAEMKGELYVGERSLHNLAAQNGGVVERSQVFTPKGYRKAGITPTTANLWTAIKAK